MNGLGRPSVRAVVYTRKSSEEGLDQEFNSLDAQYEACTAYIASQRHEGWKLVKQRFDDGGVSGGTMDRPALKALLDEVDKGLIDMIVVYKIDRLTRSLSDFARLIERLEQAGCSFVSVTQSCLPRMAERGWGRVVNIGSINQFGPKPIVTAYAATKAAQHNLIQSQARAYAQTGVILNTLAPGLIDTDRNAGRKSSDTDAWASYVAEANWMGRAGHVDEMVGAALFLSTQASSFMTGEVLTLSGGY